MNQLRAVLLGVALAFLVMPSAPSFAGSESVQAPGVECPAGQTKPLVPGECVDASDVYLPICGGVTLVLGSVAVGAGSVASILFLTGIGAAPAALLTGVSWITGIVSLGVSSVCLSVSH